MPAHDVRQTMRFAILAAALAWVAALAADAPAQPEPAASEPVKWLELPANAPVRPPGERRWAELGPDELVAAIRNADLMWEMEFPTAQHDDFWWVGPHYSPRGRPGTPTYALMPYPPAWVEVRTAELNDVDGGAKNGAAKVSPDEPRRPPFPLARVADPLLKALADPDRWVAAHVVLTHVTLRGEPDAKAARRLRDAIRWPGRATIQGSGAWLLNLDDRENLRKNDDGWYEDTFAGLPVRSALTARPAANGASIPPRRGSTPRRWSNAGSGGRSG